MPEAVPVLLDTDIGSDIDDALALVYLLAERGCRLLGVSTVSGEARKRAMLASAICHAAARSEVPVTAGAEQPLLGEQRQPTAPQARVLSRWEHQEEFAPNAAVNLMRDTIREYPGEITLLSIGPLTNLALLFALDREIPAMLRQLVVMGGRFFARGGPEWNVRCDPWAAAIVFSAGVRDVRLIGLDVTTRCRMDKAEFREAFAGGPLNVVSNMAEVWFEDRDSITFHDPLAACCVAEPDVCTYRRGRAQVELCDAERLGATSLAEQEGGPHGAADGVDVDEFFQHYLDTIELWR